MILPDSPVCLRKLRLQLRCLPLQVREVPLQQGQDFSCRLRSSSPPLPHRLLTSQTAACAGALAFCRHRSPTVRLAICHAWVSAVRCGFGVHAAHLGA